MLNMCRALLLIAMVTLLSGCMDRKILDSIDAGPGGKAGRQVADQLVHGAFDNIVSQFDPIYQNRPIRPRLEQMASLFPHEAPVKVILVGATYTQEKLLIGPTSPTTPEHTTKYELQFEYDYQNAWRLVQIRFHIDDQDPIITDISVSILPASLEDMYAFRLGRLSGLGLTALGLGVINIAFVIWTLVQTWRHPLPRWRWLWRVAILWGVFSWSVNCIDGQWSWYNFQLQFPVVWADWGPYRPLVLTLHFPLFAIIYWWRQERRWARETEALQALVTKSD